METRREFEARMLKNYPLLYADMYGDPLHTVMAFGVEVNSGWWEIIDDLSAKLEEKIKPIYKEAMENPDARCAQCGRKRQWHWFFYLIYTVKYFFMNKLKASEAYPQWRKRDRWHKRSIWKTLYYALFKFKWYKACKRWQPSYPKAVQIKEKFGCYDEKTEVLTRDGWKLFNDITYNDEIATLEDGKCLKYCKPLDIIKYYYSGPMYRLNTRGISLLVTPNHKLYVAKGTYYNGKYKPPKKVKFPMELATPNKYFGKNKRFIKGAIWSGEKLESFVLPEYKNEWDRGYYGKTRKVCEPKIINIIDWLQFLGWYIAEGCCNSAKGEVSIACNNTDNGTEELIIRNVIDHCGFQIKKSIKDRPALLFKIYSKQLAVWLSENCGRTSKEKKVPLFIKNLSPYLIEIFLASLFAGDGSLQETSYIYSTISKELVDDIQELILKAGYTSRIYDLRFPRKTGFRGNYPCYEINWMLCSNEHNTSNKGWAKSSKEEWIQYNGMVYCVSVPNNIIHIRRRGKHVWCGNSLRLYMSHCTDEIEELIDEAENKSRKTCERCGKPGKPRNGGWILTLCDECDKK